MARDAAYQFLRIGVRASVFDDGQLMLMSAALLRRGDVVMAFSHSGQTAAVVEAAQQARQNGAHLIALTNRSDSPLGQESDVALCANLDSLPWAGENAAARLVQLSVLRRALERRGAERLRSCSRRTSAAPPLPQAGVDFMPGKRQRRARSTAVLRIAAASSI